MSLIRITIFSCLLSSFFSCRESAEVDLIIRNGNIYTINDNFETAKAMAIKDGKIVAIGPENEILNKYFSKELIDAESKAIYPGFIDAHCHFVGFSKNLLEVNLIGTTSFDQVLAKIKDFIKENKLTKEQWIIGRGWDEHLWENKTL